MVVIPIVVFYNFNFIRFACQIATIFVFMTVGRYHWFVCLVYSVVEVLLLTPVLPQEILTGLSNWNNQ